MTFAQFLHEAGFWQWCGMICIAAAISPSWSLKTKIFNMSKDPKP